MPGLSSSASVFQKMTFILTFTFRGWHIWRIWKMKSTSLHFLCNDMLEERWHCSFWCSLKISPAPSKITFLGFPYFCPALLLTKFVISSGVIGIGSWKKQKCEASQVENPSASFIDHRSRDQWRLLRRQWPKISQKAFIADIGLL